MNGIVNHIAPLLMSQFLRALLLAAGWFLAANLCAADRQSGLPDAPPPAQVAIQERVGKGTLTEIKRKTEFPIAAFEVTFTHTNKTWTFSVDAEGKLLRQQIVAGDLPAEVRPSFKKVAGTGKIQKIERVLGSDGPTYEVELTRSGRPGGFALAQDGALLSKLVELKDAPAAARKTIQATADGAEIKSIHRIYTDGEQDYRVQVPVDGRTRTFNVESDGNLFSLQVFEMELPAPVQRTLRSQLGTARLGDIYKVFSGDEHTYHAEFARGTKSRSLHIDSDGKLTHLQIELLEAPAPVGRMVREILGEGEVDEVFMNLVERKRTYEIAKRQNGREQTMSISATGKLLECDLDIPWEQLPAAVRMTVETKLPGQISTGSTKMLKDGSIRFLVAFGQKEKQRLLILDQNGAFIREVQTIALTEASPEVQAAVKKQVGKGKLVNLLRLTVDGAVVFEVELLKGGKREVFTLSAAGEPMFLR